MDFFINKFLAWLPIIFLSIVFAITAYFFLRRQNTAKFSEKKYKILSASVVFFYIFHSLILTFFQYYSWSHSNFGKIFLKLPLDSEVDASNAIARFFDWLFNNKFEYFLFYSYGRFWLNSFISIFIAFVFYLFLKMLKKYKDRFFEDGEIELGLLAALIVGWPKFVIFVPVVFLFIILVSVFKLVYRKEAYTTFGWPFILGTLLVLIFGAKILFIFGLNFLSI